ncbi:TetR/AcrR family transcriptional regulator [Halopseudomonas salegens]|uniref:Transcriptional regulator, TetR family n=1 Tax=Halopseudomonas salegens TaxID=1434072 RepID=A0A1H2HJC1_9GAMM|nr:TetR/AcrR family transcriptional regulator [Halopseudomonas salegens]SDU31967.1 transcriptional regulator, TetR family [Halopseudomonas salegens]
MTSQSTAKKPGKPRIKDKRAAILRAALEVFAEGGVNGVPMPVLAERASVGTGTIYRYFVSKEALVNELFRELKHTVTRRFFADIGPEVEPHVAFDLVWQRMIEFTREDPAAYRFLELQDHRPYLDDRSRTLDRKQLRNVVAHYRSYQNQGIFRQDIRPEVLLSLVWGAFVNLVRAERDGYIELSQQDIDSARDACWSLCTG